MHRDLAQRGEGADVVEGPHPVDRSRPAGQAVPIGHDLAALSDRDDPESALVLGRVDDVGDELAVSGLEDVQRHHEAGHEQAREREEGDDS